MTADGFAVDRNMVLLRDRADDELQKMLAEIKGVVYGNNIYTRRYR